MAVVFRTWLQRCKSLSESSSRNYTGYLTSFLRVRTHTCTDHTYVVHTHTRTCVCVPPQGGHALVAMYTSGADEVYKATIMPRGQALGMVMQLPEGDRLNYTKKQALA
eukprot:20356-Eustigmatos_ZCMA.PRE.1